MKIGYMLLFFCSVLAALWAGPSWLKAILITSALVNADGFLKLPRPSLTWKRNDKRILIRD